MKVRANDPGSDSIVIAFNGSITGFVLEADDVEGYIIQADWGPPTDFLRVGNHGPFREVRAEGKVAFLGNCDTDSREDILTKLNEHRVDCGLPPYEAAA